MLAPKKSGIVSPTNIFVLFNGDTMFKLKKGASPEDAIQLLGQPIKAKQGKNPKNKRFYFKLGWRYYELLFLDDCLELCINTKKL